MVVRILREFLCHAVIVISAVDANADATYVWRTEHLLRQIISMT